MNSTNLKKWLSVALSTFAGAAVAYGTAALQSGAMPTTSAAIQALLLGACLAGVSAVVHLLQTPPTAGPVAAMKMVFKKAVPPTVMMLALGVVLGGSVSCTPAQSANAISDVNIASQAVAQACVDAALIAPLLDPSLPPATESSLKDTCPVLAGVADSIIDQMIALFTKQQPGVAAKLAAYKRARQAQGKW